jgi:3-oxoadipate enol-lactonase
MRGGGAISARRRLGEMARPSPFAKTVMTSPFFVPLPGRLIPINGIELFVSETGTGRPVVLVHGLGWSHALWHRVISQLSGRYRVIAGDTRGHGRSAKPAGPYTMGQLASDWAGVLDACNVDSCALIGLSQGGMIAMSLAAQFPERVAVMGLLATAAHFSDAAWKGMEERGKIAREIGIRAAAEQTATSLFSSDFAAQNPSLVKDFVENRVAAAAAALGAATQSLRGFDIRQQLPRLRCPVFIMHGTADRVIPVQSADEIKATLPHAELVREEGAGHILPVERPDDVEMSLARFLDRHYSA